MRKFSFHTAFLFVLLLSASSDLAYAFSMNQIEVQSKFGDPFRAEIVVLDDEKPGLEVRIGSASDYARLELDRKPIVDSLMVDPDYMEAGPGKKRVRIYSEKPLFYPSFDLVVLANLEGNTVMENFFLAVDFRTNLSIGIGNKKRKAAKAPREEATAPSLLLESSQAGTEESAIRETPLTEEKTPSAPPLEEFKATEEKPIKETVAHAKPLPREEIPVPASPLPEAMAKPLLSTVSSYGDTLFKIAQRISKGARNLERFVVALWNLNREKFLYGNMNKLEGNTELDYTHLEKEMAGISDREARWVIKNQWEEFLYIKSLLAKGKRDEEWGSPLREVSLPGELDQAADAVAETIGEWQRAWEEKNLEKYISIYSPLFQAKVQGNVLYLREWKEHKDKIFGLPESVGINISHLHIRRERDHYLGTFIQTYRSGDIDAVGLKTLDFIFDGGEWKIFREGFEKMDPLPTGEGRPFPFVLHVGSFKNLEVALKEGNRLRRFGYPAFLTPVDVKGKGRFFRVGLGRFATKKEAALLAENLIHLKVIPQGGSLDLPYALEIDSFASEGEAFQRVRDLRDLGISAYILTRGPEKGGPLRHQVFVGAFATSQEAQGHSRLLEQKEIRHRILKP